MPECRESVRDFGQWRRDDAKPKSQILADKFNPAILQEKNVAVFVSQLHPSIQKLSHKTLGHNHRERKTAMQNGNSMSSEQQSQNQSSQWINYGL